MLFFVRFDVTQPANVGNEDLIAIWMREAEAAIGAMDAGAVPHLWKVAGQRVVLGVVDVPIGRGPRPRARRPADHPRDGPRHEDRGVADLRLPHVRRGPQRGRATGTPSRGLTAATAPAAARLLLGGRAAALALALRAAALGVQAPRARGLRRLRRAAHARDLERARQPAGQPLERERAVARLAARVLRDRAHDRPAARRRRAPSGRRRACPTPRRRSSPRSATRSCWRAGRRAPTSGWPAGRPRRAGSRRRG